MFNFMFDFTGGKMKQKELHKLGRDHIVQAMILRYTLSEN